MLHHFCLYLGYGENGAGSAVPGAATLQLDVELLEIKDGNPVKETHERVSVFKLVDKDNNKVLSREEMKEFMKLNDQMHDPSMPSHEELITEVFKYEDKDKDGVISYHEFNSPKHDVTNASEPVSVPKNIEL